MHAAFSEFILPSYEKPLKYVPRTVSRYRDMKHVLRSLFQRFVKQFPDTFNFYFFFGIFFNLMMMILFLPNIIFRQQILCVSYGMYM